MHCICQQSRPAELRPKSRGMCGAHHLQHSLPFHLCVVSQAKLLLYCLHKPTRVLSRAAGKRVSHIACVPRENMPAVPRRQSLMA